MKQSDTSRKGTSSLKNGSIITTTWFEDLEGRDPSPEPPFLVITRAKDLRFDDFVSTVRKHRPYHVVPPFSQSDQHYTSAAAERVRSQGGLCSKEWETKVGIVICGRGDAEELDFLVWAAAQNYSPIVIPPDRRPRSWQIGNLFQHGAIGNNWYHLPGGDRSLDVSKFPGVWTWGEPL